jgi:N-acetylmuramoyl-L-alanine amidase/Putative peptidoglycan binding domain
MTDAASLPPLKFVASPNVSTRAGARVDLVVVHDTEGAYAGAVAWFTQSRSQVSAHFVLREDGGEATQMVDLAKSAWHVCAFNRRSVGLEIAGKESAGFSDAAWLAAARIVAYLLHHLQIPCRFAEAGVGPGFCRHYDLGQAGGGHDDPTTDAAKWAWFCDLVKAEYARGDFPAIWAPGGATPHCSLSAPAAAAPAPTMSVAEIQAALNKLGASPALVVDGHLGPSTIAAIRRFQINAALIADGIAGALTLAAIEKALAA